MKTLKEIRRSKQLTRREFAQLLRIPTLCYAGYEKLPQLIPCHVAAKISAVSGIKLDDINFG